MPVTAVLLRFADKNAGIGIAFMQLKKIAIRQIDARGGIAKRKVHSVAVIGNDAGHTNLGKDTDGVAHAVAQRLECFERTYSAPERGRIPHTRLPHPVGHAIEHDISRTD